MTRYETIKEFLETLDGSDLLQLHNEYCSESNCDDFVYDMDDFDEMLDGQKPWKIARMAFFGNFSPCDQYFKINAYGNLESTDYPEEFICMSDIADYIDRNEESFGIDELEEILNGDDAE